MKSYHIGLDFGTHQTKVCVQHVEDKVHEFFMFPEVKSFFLLSRVAEKQDGTFEYGNSISGTAIQEYYYFKMAAAEDEEFWIETSIASNQINRKFYDTALYKPYTPEFLTTVYITYILLVVRKHYQNKNIIPEKRSVLSRLFNPTTNNDETKFTVRMGIPTEWSQQKNLRRKRKFENILLIVDELINDYKSPAHFLSTKISELKNKVSKYYESLHLNSIEEFKLKLNLKGLSVYPETAAGLTFITKTRQLAPGYYAIMDIGGGTTDISFFRLVTEEKIKYIASESYLVAANNVYKHMLDSGSSTEKIHNLEMQIKLQCEDNSWRENRSLIRAVKLIREQLEKLVYKLFFKRVHWFHNSGLSSKFKDQPIIVYGGGFEIPEILQRRIVINDNGVRTAWVEPILWRFQK